RSSGHQPSFAPSQNVVIGHGARQPPRKRVVATAEATTMWTYSASMNSANFSDEYSVMNPATSSDSASGRSNGARLVSPTTEMKKITRVGSSSSAYQPGMVIVTAPSDSSGLFAWAATICDVLMVPARMNTVTNDSPSDTSYEISWAEARMPPISGYGEPEAQPPSTTPYTDSAETASSTSTDTDTSVTCNGVRCPNIDTIGPNGITDSAVSAHTAEMAGAMK